MKTILFTLALTSAQFSLAATDIWKGQGTVFGFKNDVQSNYDLIVKNTKNGEKTASEILILLPDGNNINLSCTNNTSSDNSWTSDCTQGQGGGRCFGEGLCISYLENKNGKAYATTIVMDGPKKMRLLRTELQNGRAVKFYRENLQKQ